jgi:flavin reductase (DIM6/NTAB) family NADH-FMN oxidoreductase RutF
MPEFDDLVSDINGAVVIVTVAVGDDRAGCLVGFHSQCSIHPPLHAVWMSSLNRTSQLVTQARFVAVHLLGETERDLAELFGGTTSDTVDKFAEVEWDRGPGDVPLLRRCPNRFVLEVARLLETGGDHRCVVGSPVDAERTRHTEPLRLAEVIGIDAGHPPDEIIERPPPRAIRNRSDV